MEGGIGNGEYGMEWGMGMEEGAGTGGRSREWENQEWRNAGLGGCGNDQGWDGSTAPSLCRDPLWDHPEQLQCSCKPSSRCFSGLVFPFCPSSSHPSPKARAGQGPCFWQHEFPPRNFIPGGDKSLHPRAGVPAWALSPALTGAGFGAQGLFGQRSPILVPALPSGMDQADVP